MSIVRLAGVVREIGAFVILDRIDAAIAVGERIGLVGPNGAGKTTLLRIVAGTDEPDAGEVQRRRELRIGLLAQEAHLDERFMVAPDVRTAVRHGAADLERMETELAALESAHRVQEPAYADLQHRFDTLGGYTLDLRVDEALSGLGFTPDEIRRPPSALSGGEQTRAALARLVISNPDLLLLDEPTNHLDIGALEWLEEHLRRRSGALLVASHDRAFLDGTVERIWELRDRRLTPFRGNYAAFHRQRVERDERTAKDATVQTGQIARERELIQLYRSQRKFSKMHEHEARLERLQAERIETPKQRRALRLPHAAGSGPERAPAARSGQVVARLEDLVVGYAREGSVTRVARAPWLVAQRGERIGIVGPNGAGKSTLLRTIAGDLPALEGTLTFGQGVQLGYLAQLRAGAFPGTTVLDALLAAMPVTQGEARSYLARFLFRGDDVEKEVRALSGGERSRLELALLGITPANLLLLDEPTNHLDIPAREAIEAFIREVPATVLVVSHDRRLLEELVERLWVVDDGLAVPFDGGYREWRLAVAGGWTAAGAAEEEARRLRVGATVSARRPAPASTPTNGSTPGRSAGTKVAVAAATVAGIAAAPAKAPARRAAAAAKLSKEAYRRQKATAEAELTRLGLRRSHLELAMGDPNVGANFVELRRISSELADIEQALESAETAWLEIEERAP